MFQIWGQANAYARLVMVIGLIYPVCMLYLAWRIEKMYRSFEERQKEKEKPRSAATE